MDEIDAVLAEPIRMVKEGMLANVAKHGDYDPLPVQERLAKILRHAGQELSGDTSEDHWRAIATSALLALEARRLARAAFGNAGTGF